ncbi:MULTISPECIES: type II toxin-antitoxin system Phd/YefM family antitoxin [unclassified Candidatus Tisiphia]|uniref:type II toxin-antitoxin system Phd/YefM family antitoxin n=2 Tax=Rickettsiaceae TaxID=775 RepID=UPI001E0E1C7E|nr:type II toxin-antitoxin system Phd/YefM family antitoxin [Candidatus Tisiphia sp.]MDN3031254.1 type II toxin-antitoxin system Phd/YefM family antitoxin [Candidatus Tisiphia sp.]HJD56917.1 type II toxin-antitoxin system Phd/YefM family antitoxin [Rickettsia endosymbiont of Sericostoma sp. HW-2014]
MINSAIYSTVNQHFIGIIMAYLVASEARKNLYKLIDMVAEEHEPTIIKGKRNTAVLISKQDWEDIQETLLVAKNKELSQSIIKGLTTDFKDCKTKLVD